MVDYLKEYAEQHYTEEAFEAGCKKYTHARPFTKESLLYREISKNNYPGPGRNESPAFGCQTATGKAVM